MSKKLIFILLILISSIPCFSQNKLLDYCKKNNYLCDYEDYTSPGYYRIKIGNQKKHIAIKALDDFFILPEELLNQIYSLEIFSEDDFTFDGERFPNLLFLHIECKNITLSNVNQIKTLSIHADKIYNIEELEKNSSLISLSIFSTERIVLPKLDRCYDLYRIELKSPYGANFSNCKYIPNSFSLSIFVSNENECTYFDWNSLLETKCISIIEYPYCYRLLIKNDQFMSFYNNMKSINDEFFVSINE